MNTFKAILAVGLLAAAQLGGIDVPQRKYH